MQARSKTKKRNFALGLIYQEEDLAGKKYILRLTSQTNANGL